MQFDKGYKGFSFSKEGPLDMRMDPEDDLTASEIVNRYSEQKLGEIFREYGEEPHWKKAARAIVEARYKKPIETTQQLAALLMDAIGFKRGGRLHPATLVFQALRIVVNKELDAIQNGLTKALRFLAKGGKIGAISFHSLEDRLVKNIFRAACHRDKKDGGAPFMKLLTKKPLVPTYAEMRANPRSRSAKMRFAEKT
jgi:16S rRNA (cytosine1402-N4)-methyltransferase